MAMGCEKRAAATDMKKLEKKIHYYSFFRATQILYKSAGINEERLDQLAPCDEPVRFKVNSSLGFPSSDLSHLQKSSTADYKKAYEYELEVNFLGLHGVDSPLPSYFMEEVAQLLPEDAVQKYFLDFFNHRLLSILYRVWRKYRYYIRFQANAEDDFSQHIFALFGMYAPEMRTINNESTDADTEGSIKWNQLLAYSGLLASRNRSPQVICGVLSHTFDFNRDGIEISIDSFVLRKVVIPAHQRWRLGENNSSAAVNAVVGSKVADRSGKFRIVIRHLTFSRLKRFLPRGEDYKTLKKLVEFMLKDQFAYDLKLYLRSDQTPPMTLQANSEGRLGWSSFLGENKTAAEQSVTLEVRT